MHHSRHLVAFANNFQTASPAATPTAGYQPRYPTLTVRAPIRLSSFYWELPTDPDDVDLPEDNQTYEEDYTQPEDFIQLDEPEPPVLVEEMDFATIQTNLN